MYSFYDSMRIDMSLQFDLLPVSIIKDNPKQGYADQTQADKSVTIEKNCRRC